MASSVSGYESYENLWSEVTRTMDASANQPTNLAELRQAVIDAWQALPLQTLANIEL